MLTDRIETNEIAELPPFPEGWYFVASRDSLSKQKLIQKSWLGVEVVIWSDDEGQICMADAFCPHMGSVIAPDVGGQVRNGRLVCPFHGFEYDTTGQCVTTPYAPAPRSARLRLFETREILGMIFGWWGNGGRPSHWDLPAEPDVDDRWSNVDFHHFHFPGHPQETTENSVDLAHLRFVHGYDNVRRVGSVTTDGPYFRVCFDFKSDVVVAGLIKDVFDVSTVTHLFGLGYSYVEFEERTIGLRARLWVLATPVDGQQVHLVLASQVGNMQRPHRPIMGLRFLPERMRLWTMNKILLSMQAMYVNQDVVIWRRKKYRPKPRLNRADGEILAYRRYCEQFYRDRLSAGRRLISKQA